MADVLTDLVSTKELGFCGRELLGKVCVSAQYECLCKDAVSTYVESTHDGHGGAVVALTIELDPYAGSDWKNIRRNVELLGYRAAYKVGSNRDTHGTVVTCTFDLADRANRDVRSHMVEIGL
jgi:hypothetical protein